MAMVRLAVGRLQGERRAFSRGAVSPSTVGTPLRLLQSGTAIPPFCAGCAAPIEYGAVIRGAQVFCSVECTLGGDQPA